MPAETLPYQRSDAGVLTLTLSAGDAPVVILNRALIQSINATLDAALAEGDPTGFVLASDSRVFVAGADLKEIMSLNDAQLIDYLELGANTFARIAKLPCTTVAAINGATMGGGLEIALHCDTLIAATTEKPYPIGLPEAGLKICPGWGGTNLLPARMAASPGEAERAIRMTATGTVFKSPQEASEAGVIAELVDPTALHERAAELAAKPKQSTRETPRCIADADVRENVTAGLAAAREAGLEGDAAQTVANCVETGLKDGWNAATQLERTELTRLRNTPEGKAAIQAFFDKSAKKN